MQTYKIWNPEKMHMLGLSENATYDELVAAEHKIDSSLSSIVFTDDIESLIDSIYNETDVVLSYHLCGA